MLRLDTLKESWRRARPWIIGTWVLSAFVLAGVFAAKIQHAPKARLAPEVPEEGGKRAPRLEAVSRDCLEEVFSCYTGIPRETLPRVSELSGDWDPDTCKAYFCEKRPFETACDRDQCEALCDRCFGHP